MKVDFKLLDQFNLSNNLTRNFACDISEDNRIFIITDIGLYILSFRGDVADPFLSFSCKKYFLSVTDYTPCANIDLDINCFHKELERKDLYETVMTTEYSVNLKHTKPIEPVPLAAAWSPKGLAKSTDCALAVLSNLYSLEVYVRILNKNELVEYSLVLNISSKIIEEEKKHWNCATKFSIPLKLSEFKNRVNKVSATAFAWSHIFNVNNQNYSTLFVGHMNGDITAWRLHTVSGGVENWEVTFLGRYSTQLNRITTMHWHKSADYGGGLLFADIDGKMSLLHITNLNHTEAYIDKEIAFWSESDRIKIEKITVMMYDNYIFILIAKQRVLIIYAIDEIGELVDQKASYIEDYYITGLYHFDNIILVLSLTGVLTQFSISIENKQITLEEKKIPLRIGMNLYRTHGFFISKNMALFGLLTYPWELQSFSRNKTPVKILIFQNTNIKPFDILWNNKSGSLSDYWDCFEALRLICLKEKRFPWLGLPADLVYDNLTLLQLKTLRFIAKMSEMVFNTVPVIKSYDIKPFIIIHYLVEIKLVVRRLHKLFNLRNSGKQLTTFQLQSVDIQNFFLKEMVAKNILAKANVGRNFVKEVRTVMAIANEIRYPDMVQCVWCGEKIIGSSCVPPHADSRCSFSMMPIFLIPTYKCPFCKALAHRKIEEEESVMICLYCDVPMDRIPVDSEQVEEEAKANLIDCNGEVKSKCYEDCLKDSEVSDIGENENDYMILSDSESEDGDDQSQLRTLYLKFRNASLQDIVVQDSEEYNDEPGPSKKSVKLSDS